MAGVQRPDLIAGTDMITLCAYACRQRTPISSLGSHSPLSNHPERPQKRQQPPPSCSPPRILHVSASNAHSSRH